MIVGIEIKNPGKTRGVSPIFYNLPEVKNLEELIKALVNIEIDKYEKSGGGKLEEKEILEQMETGKISFGFKYNDGKIDRKKSEEIALTAFNDGLYVVFINGKKIENLTDEITLDENTIIAIIRLTMLAGRYF